MTLNAFVFRHIVKDGAATECVDGGIGFPNGKAIKDCANAGF